MRCPACGVEVEEGADLCLECGEPMVDSPAARVARKDAAVKDAPAKPAPEPKRVQAVSGKGGTAAPEKMTIRGKLSALVPELAPIRCPACGAPTTKARCPADGTRLRDDD